MKQTKSMFVLAERKPRQRRWGGGNGADFSGDGYLMAAWAF
jgi:hypothetical protein